MVGMLDEHVRDFRHVKRMRRLLVEDAPLMAAAFGIREEPFTPKQYAALPSGLLRAHALAVRLMESNFVVCQSVEEWIALVDVIATHRQEWGEGSWR